MCLFFLSTLFAINEICIILKEFSIYVSLYSFCITFLYSMAFILSLPDQLQIILNPYNAVWLKRMYNIWRKIIFQQVMVDLN